MSWMSTLMQISSVPGSMLSSKRPRVRRFHAGYARYFTPPPLELVQSQTINQFVGTSNQSAILQNTAVKPERANYFDAGMTQQFTARLSMGVDGYYKISRDLIDEGQFGSALIFTPFNYAKGNQYGVEVTANCNQSGFNAYANFGFERGTGSKLSPVNFFSSPDELAFIRNHWVFLDHDQRYTLLPAHPTPTKTPRSMPTSFMAAASAVALRIRMNSTGVLSLSTWA